MLRVGFKPAILLFERSKTVSALDVIGTDVEDAELDQVLYDFNADRPARSQKDLTGRFLITPTEGTSRCNVRRCIQKFPD
jgi:hypothetical protein